MNTKFLLKQTQGNEKVVPRFQHYTHTFPRAHLIASDTYSKQII